MQIQLLTNISSTTFFMSVLSVSVLVSTGHFKPLCLCFLLVQACDPFRVSYMAAWARVARIDKVCDWKLNQVSDTENSMNFMNAMSDACTKSGVLVDSLNRSNETYEATKVFRESVEKWARSGVTSLRKSFPHSLLQPWLKVYF
jgi:hypothetical protein